MASSPRENEQPKRIARQARPRHEPARPASTAVLPVDSPAGSAVKRASSPGEHDRVAGRLAGELDRATDQLARRARAILMDHSEPGPIP
ncbi:hypothetical protein F2Q70_00011757 [Brassica cretica]|uniref:Uncharacterized protein n=1 Tax=Brassica cretica TaxID=69181 RepID=A0A8S9M2U4_BRACR|nr:hypothetical protein F2Q70_00011757 [Brassica cretica]